MKKRIVLFATAGLVLMLVGAHADTIVLDSGKSITGEIIEETLDEVVVKLPSGVTTRVNRDEIIEIKRAQDLEKEFKKRRKEILEGDTYRMMELAEWCRQRGLKKHQREMLKGILEMDPDDAEAKRELKILDGKLPESARNKKTGSGDMIFVAGEGRKKGETGKGSLKKLKKVRKTRRIWGDRKSRKLKKSRPSKFKPKGCTEAAFRGLDWLMQNGTRVKWGPQGQVVSAAFAGMACLASGNNKYSGLLDRCVNAVRAGLKRYLTGKRSGSQANWAVTIGGIFLAEAYHYYKTPELKGILQQVCAQLTINQEESGGYAHGPGQRAKSGGYLEIEVMSNFAVACMGMCKQHGVSVPKEKFRKAVEYIEACVTPRGVGYSVDKDRNWAQASRTGGAIFALAMANAKSGKFRQVCTILDRRMKDVIDGHATPALSFYQCAVGSLQVGRALWDKYVQMWFPMILEHQEKDGSFRSIKNPKEPTRKWETDMGPAFCTAIYSFILLVDRGHLRFSSGCSRGR